MYILYPEAICGWSRTDKAKGKRNKLQASYVGLIIISAYSMIPNSAAGSLYNFLPCSSMLLLVFSLIPCRNRFRIFFKYTLKLSPLPSGNGDPHVFLFTLAEKVFIEDFLGPYHPEYSFKAFGAKCLYDRNFAREFGVECKYIIATWRNQSLSISSIQGHKEDFV